MDIAPTTHLSLCSGYGGIDLGLRRAIPNLRTVAYAEIEAFAVENLLARMDGGSLDAAPIWPDIKTFPWESFRDRVDILSAGYPCQPFSAAGKRHGTEDPRHLWPYIADGVRILRPRVCFFENVEGHISLGLQEVIGELESMGYSVSWGIFSASEVGAPHQRKRVFILAMANNSDTGLQGLRECRGSQGWQAQAGHVRVGGNIWPSRPGEQQYGWEPPRVVADASGAADRCDDRSDWQAESSLGGDADGSPGGMDYAELCISGDNRTDELRLLGNGVVPATAILAFETLLRITVLPIK